MLLWLLFIVVVVLVVGWLDTWCMQSSIMSDRVYLERCCSSYALLCQVSIKQNGIYVEQKRSQKHRTHDNKDQQIEHKEEKRNKRKRKMLLSILFGIGISFELLFLLFFFFLIDCEINLILFGFCNAIEKVQFSLAKVILSDSIQINLNCYFTIRRRRILQILVLFS